MNELTVIHIISVIHVVLCFLFKFSAHFLVFLTCKHSDKGRRMGKSYII